MIWRAILCYMRTIKLSKLINKSNKLSKLWFVVMTAYKTKGFHRTVQMTSSIGAPKVVEPG